MISTLRRTGLMLFAQALIVGLMLFAQALIVGLMLFAQALIAELWPRRRARA